MIVFAKHRAIVCLLGVACLIGSAEAQAQSRDVDARKRAFSELLARRAKSSRAESRRETAAESRIARRTAHTTRSARSTRELSLVALSTSPFFAAASPLAASATGVSPATPLVPSGFGPRKDAFVETLYSEILGRNPTQSELDYWAGVLNSGVGFHQVASLIWRSQEHQTLVRSGAAPNVPKLTAYHDAIAARNSH